MKKLQFGCCPDISAVSLSACEQARRSRSQRDERPRNDTGIINSVISLGLQKIDKICGNRDDELLPLFAQVLKCTSSVAYIWYTRIAAFVYDNSSSCSRVLPLHPSHSTVIHQTLHIPQKFSEPLSRGGLRLHVVAYTSTM